MAASTMLFIFVGVSVATANIMRFVEWLDTPRGSAGDGRVRHAA